MGWGPWALQIPPGDALRLHVAFWDFADFCRFFPPRNSRLSVCNCQAESPGPASPFAGGQDSSRCQGLWLKTGQGEPCPCRRQHRGCSAHVPGKAAFSRTARLQPPASKCLGDELQAGRPQPRRTPRHRGAPRFYAERRRGTKPGGCGGQEGLRSPPGQCFLRRHFRVSSSAGHEAPSSRGVPRTSRTRVSKPHLQPQVRPSWVQALHSPQGPGSHVSGGKKGARGGGRWPHHAGMTRGVRGAGAAYLGTRGCRAAPRCRAGTAGSTDPCAGKTSPCTSCRSLC